MTAGPTIAVLGHVEHVTLAQVPALPAPGEILHLGGARFFPGGGGGVSFYQLTRGPGRVLLFTALGQDDAGRLVDEALATSGAELHIARRAAPHTRDVVLVPPGGNRTILVLGEPLHPVAADPLAWAELARCDAAYFTAQDPDLLRLARQARTLVVTGRRREALVRSGVRADVVVGSASDPREACALADYPVPPSALVMTEGGEGGYVETANGRQRFPAAPLRGPICSDYGAGDSFAGALTHFLALGLDPLEAARRAAPYGAAVLAGVVPLEAQLPLPGRR